MNSLDEFRGEYEKLRSESDPPTFDEFVVKFRENPLNWSANRYIHRVVDSEKVVGHLCQMTWNVVRFDSASSMLLTSDRPTIMSNGIGIKEGHIALPISPRMLFIAFSDDAGYWKVRAIPLKELANITNSLIAQQAHDYVYGFSKAALSFVATRLGKRVPATPLDTGILRLLG